MKTDKISIQRLPWALLAGASALLLALGLVLLLSHFQALAQPAAEITAANLEVSKDVNTYVAAPSDRLTYTIHIWNTGGDSTYAWLTDTLPVELTYITDSLTATVGTFGVENGVVTWTHPNLGYQAWITFSVEISSGITTCAEIENTAQVTGSGRLVEDSAKTTVVAEMGNLDNAGTYKSVSSDMAEPGDVLVYTITLKNDSGDSVPNVRVTDELPSALIPLTPSLTADEGAYGIQNGVITWTLDMGEHWADIDLTFSAQISPDLAYDGWITNTVEIADPLRSFTRTVGTKYHRRYGNLDSSTKSVAPDWAKPDENFNYTIRIANTGDGPVETVWMTDTLPSEVNYASGLAATRGSCGVAGDVITWTGSLSPSEAATITFAVKITSTLSDNTCITNTAEITGAGKLVLAQASAWGMTHFDMYFPLFFHNYPPIPVLQPIPDPDNHAYDVEWQPVEVSIDQYVLQQARTSDFSSVERSWTIQETSQHVGDVYCAYYYRVRADKASDWGDGPWGNVEQGKASPPDPPVLDDIPDPDEDNAYTISWSSVPDPIDGVAVEQYVLQEATDANFSNVTNEWSTTGTSQQIQKGSTDGTFYYRVRADDYDCWGQGGWSNVEQVTVLATYFDDFDDSSSGWPEEKVWVYYSQSAQKDIYWRRGYKDGDYRIYIDAGGPNMWFIQPSTLAPYRPPDKFCIEASVRYYKWGWWDNSALIFGANEENTELYMLGMSYASKEMGWGLLHKRNYEFPKRAFFGAENYAGEDKDPDLVYNAWNKLQVSVDGDKVLSVYINGKSKLSGPIKMPGLSGMTRVGFLAGVYEITPMDWRVKYFKVTPNVECSP